MITGNTNQNLTKMKKVQLLIVCITLLLWSGINAQERRTVHSDDAVTLKNVSAFNIEQKAQAEAELKTPVAAENKKPEKQQRSVAAECSVPVFPLNEGFQGFPPECWQIFNVDGNDWSWGHISGNINGEDYMATWSTSIGDMEDNWLVTRLVSVPASNNITLQFKNVQGCYNTGGTINHGVYVSTGSNNPADGNFTEIWTMPETGTSAGIIDVNLTSYAGQDIYIGFRFAGNNQWNWEITDIRVFDTNKIDAQVVSIISPISNGDLGNETVKALIKNNGGQNITGCSLTLEVDGAEVATETFTQSISLFEEVEYTFAAKANLSAEGDHVVKVTVNLAGDGDASNNSSSKTVTNTICRPITSYPWSEGFESEVFPPACWASYNVDGDNLSWEKYTSYYHSGSASARHPFNYWGDNNQEGWLVTPQLSIPSTGSYILTFWSVINNFRGSDEAAIYVSTTGNNPSTDTFTQIKTISGDEISSTSFKEMAVSLSDYAG